MLMTRVRFLVIVPLGRHARKRVNESNMFVEVLQVPRGFLCGVPQVTGPMLFEIMAEEVSADSAQDVGSICNQCQDNLDRYLHLVAHHRASIQIQEQSTAFREGMECLGCDLISTHRLQLLPSKSSNSQRGKGISLHRTHAKIPIFYMLRWLANGKYGVLGRGKVGLCPAKAVP